MKDDTISRQAAIDAFLTELTKRERTSLLHTWSTVEVKYFIAKILEQLPSAQPGWIPVTERLPKDDTEVIVSCMNDSGDYEYSYVTTGWHYKGLWVVNNDRCYFVRAWQPLPAKPWEGGENDGKN